MPGRNEQSGAAKAAASVDFMNELFLSFIFFNGRIFCFGTENLLFMLMIREEVPKRPVKRGRSGSLTGSLNAAKPMNPASRKTIRELIISFSEKIRKKEMKIRINGMIAFIRLKKYGRNKMKIGAKSRIIGIAIREP